MFAMAIGNPELGGEYKAGPQIIWQGECQETGLAASVLQGFLSLYEIIESLKIFIFPMGFKNINIII